MSGAILTDDIKQQWLEVCVALRDSLGDSTYQSWIKPLAADSLDDGRIKMLAPTRFIRDWISKHYLSAIISAWQLYNPNVTSAIIEVRSFNFTNPSQSVAFTVSDRTKVTATESAKPAETLSFNLQPPAGSNDFADVCAPLDPNLSFENFVVGTSNNFAYAAARKVAETRKVSFNPLFLHSGVGLGKTHLMQAIGNHIARHDPTRTVMYLSAEKFMYKFISACRSHETISFKEKFRSVDVLMVDDLQFIAGKGATQEEFFHTFNELINAGKQIVLSADRAPAELDGFEVRLKSRFAAGLEVDIHPATPELRMGILKSKAEQSSVIVPDEVIEFLADHISSNIRELQGAFNRLITYTELMNCPITIESTREILHDILTSSAKLITLEEIRDTVASHFNVKVADLRGVRRQREIARPRQIAMYLAKTLTTRSLPDIGRVFDRDHTTVMHAVKTIEDFIEKDANLAEDIKLITRKLSA